MIGEDNLGQQEVVGMKKGQTDFDEDSLEIMSREVEDLENDELSIGEAVFLHGYDEEEECYEGI